MLRSRAPFAVADTAFIELAFVLGRYYEFSRPDIALALQSLLAMPTLNCNTALIEDALPLFTAHPKLSFEDCCLSSYAKLNKTEPLWTFDKKLASQAPNAQLVP